MGQIDSKLYEYYQRQLYLFITKVKGTPSPEPAQRQQYPKQFFS
jgi:hypothetical protein